MELIWLVVKGMIIGLLFSAPIGPINVMCIRETFHHGFTVGLASGIGAVVADTAFAAMAAFGITAISDQIAGYAPYFQAIAGIALVYVGIKVAFCQTAPGLDGPVRSHPGRAALTAFGMTLTNPATVLGFVTVFGSLGDLAPDQGDYFGALLLVAGVFAGGIAWWLLLSLAIASVRQRLTERTLVTINHVAAGALLLFGVGLLGGVAWQYVA